MNTAAPKTAPESDFSAPRKWGERTATVAERIDTFVERLRTTEPKGIFAAVMAEIRELKAHYALRSVRVALSRYRHAVRGAYDDDHPALKYLHSFRSDIEAYNAAYRANVFRQHHALKPIEPDFFVERALGQLESRSYGQTVAALLLLTGRRPVEVCFSGEFALVPARDDLLRFAGQAKAKGIDKPPFEVPVLAGDTRDVLAAVEVVRERHTFACAADVNAKKGKEIGEAAQRLFGAGYGPQELRKVYASIAYHDYDQSQPQARLSEPSYLASILGHSDGDVNTTLSYMTYYVEGDFDRTVVNFQEGMRALLTILQERYCIADAKARPFIEADLKRVADLVSATSPPEEPM